MIVRLHMSRDVLTLEPDAPASRALRLLQEHGVHHAPVVERGRLVGMVTDRDLLRALPGSVAELERSGADADPLVRYLMTPDPITIGPNDHVADAARILLERRINGLPVVRDGELIGILTSTDLFLVFARLLASSKGSRVTLLQAPGRALASSFDLLREVLDAGLRLESLVHQDSPGGGVVIEVSVDGPAEAVERLVARAGAAGYAMLVSAGDAARRSA